MNVHSVSIDQVNVGDRQRKDVGDISNLAENIAKFGLLHPIVITSDSYMLMAGERRLLACRSLGWTQIPAHFFEELSPRDQFCIEFIENEKRQNLNWKERAEAIQRYHFMCVTEDGRSHTRERTAQDLHLSAVSVTEYLQVANELAQPLVAQATSIKTAANTVRRLTERREADSMYTTSATEEMYTSPIIRANFNEWAPSYSGPLFNLIHCDFPYGINSHKSEGQNSALEVDYIDSPATFWHLYYTLRNYIDNICTPSAHMIFWFSPNIYCEVQSALSRLEGFRFEEHPLIWMRGENEGIAPDPSRRPRRVYEMAFFGWRGDRPLIRTKANIVQAPSVRADHPHEKSETALRHFLEMVVDANTHLLDPTCGSGSALRAASALGAARVVGLDTSEEYVHAASRAYHSWSRGHSLHNLSDLVQRQDYPSQDHGLDGGHSVGASAN